MCDGVPLSSTQNHILPQKMSRPEDDEWITETPHEAFMIEIRCLEGTFGCKSYDLSDWYRLYIGCKKAGSTITNQNKGLLDRIRLIPRQ